MSEQSMAGWGGEEEGAGDELYTYSPDGRYRETWRGAPSRVHAVSGGQILQHGPDSGFLREELGAGKKIWEWHALGSLLSTGLASIMSRASLDSREVPALMIHRMEKKTQLLGASVLHFSNI